MEELLSDRIYAGFSGVKLGVESICLSNGMILRKTFAHLFAPYMVAFAPPGMNGHHPGPWHPAEGGIAFDVQVELSVQPESPLGGDSNAIDVVWWIAALLRVAGYPYLTVPVLSNSPFAVASSGDVRDKIVYPYEVDRRIMAPPDNSNTTLRSEDIEWLKDCWVSSGRLLHSHGKFYSAFKAFDKATVEGKISSSLLLLWGGLEQLFGYGRFRIASFLAAYLHDPGEKRLSTYRHILKLYDARSTAAHTADNVDLRSLVETYVMMRNALVRMVDERRVPSQKDLEGYLFGRRG